MKTATTRLLVAAMLAAVIPLLNGGCASKGYVEERIAAVETRQAAVDYAQNAVLVELEDGLQQALDRANQAFALAETDGMVASITQTLTVPYDANSTSLNEAAQIQLQELVTGLKQDGKIHYIEVQGHTDSSGSDETNMQVGQLRADAVRIFLNEQGIPLRFISTISFGERMPVADDKSLSARNRRAEIIVME